MTSATSQDMAALAESRKLREIYEAVWGHHRSHHLDVHSLTLSRIARLLETEKRVRQAAAHSERLV